MIGRLALPLGAGATFFTQRNHTIETSIFQHPYYRRTLLAGG
jgi:hypothetical protein